MSGLNFLCSGELVCESKSVTQPVPRQGGAKLGFAEALKGRGFSRAEKAQYFKIAASAAARRAAFYLYISFYDIMKSY
jgi:hypothetical protein